MKNKLMIGMFALFAISMVAAIAYYGVFSTTFTVVSAVSISECSDQFGDIYSGEIIIGDECIITNNAPSERVISITDNSNEDVDVEYNGNLVLAKKDLTTWIPTTDTETITYTIVGDEFKVSGVPTGYVAVYYPNTINYAHYDGVVVLADDVIINLPVSEDLNGGVSSDYCTNGKNIGATQCVGAKLWLVPSDAVSGNVVDWNRASEFYFETALIQFNTEGNIILSSGSSLTITPVYTIGNYATGDYNITTEIA